MSVNMPLKDFSDHRQYGYRSVVTWISFASAFVNWENHCYFQLAFPCYFYLRGQLCLEITFVQLVLIFLVQSIPIALDGSRSDIMVET